MLPQPKILIVDDEEVVRDFCQRVLQHQGLAVELAANGQAALDALSQGAFDLILLDISMPVLSGLRVLEYIAANYSQVSPIMMTGYATLESAVQAQDLGAEGFILKPFDHEKLIKVINKIIARRQLRQDYARLQAQLPLLTLSQRLITEQNLDALAESALKIAGEETGAANAALWLMPSPASSLDWTENALTAVPACLARLGQPPLLPPLPPAWSDPWLALDEQGNPVAAIDQAVTLHLLLQTEEHQVGMLSLAHPSFGGRCFGSKDLDFLTMMSSYLAIGLENRYLYEVIDLARQEWKTIFNTLDDGLLAFRAGVITRANQTLAGWLNTTVEALIRQPITSVPIDEQGHILGDLFSRPEQANELNRYSAEFSAPPWSPGRTFRVRTFPLYQGSRAVEPKQLPVEIIYVLEDITQASKMQAQLLQTEKLSALGRLLASLAHEINNPLQALRSGLRLLARPNLDDEKRQRYVATLDKEVERLIDTTMQTLDFARPSRIGKKTTLLNQLLRETLVLVNKQLQRNKVETLLELSSNLPAVQVVPDQIKQVFLNLILNAIDAMPDGGRLRLTTRHLPADNAVLAALSDTGRGIPPRILDKIYEPFFSTKEAGTGLGLSISYSIVEAHGGHIEVTSRVNAGSTFAVYLPVTVEGDDGTA
jgi:two-component system, NtrC family, sensor kinase